MCVLVPSLSVSLPTCGLTTEAIALSDSRSTPACEKRARNQRRFMREHKIRMMVDAPANFFSPFLSQPQQKVSFQPWGSGGEKF